MPRRTIEDQFQVGENVLFAPENIITRIAGYVWIERMGEASQIGAYRLECGTLAAFDHLQKIPSGRTDY